MNSRGEVAVEPTTPTSAHVIWVALLTAFVLSGSACVEVEGGAVELSWSLRTFEGNSIDSCEDANIERVRLCWTSLDVDAGGSTGGCRPPSSRDFPCEKERGATGFEVPPGKTSLYIQPICPEGGPATAGTYQVPPPIVRTVVEGEVATLNSLLLVVTDRTSAQSACPPSGCTCDPARAR